MLPNALHRAILDFLPPVQTRPPDPTRQSRFARRQGDGPLAEALRPVSTEAATALVSNGYAVIDGVLGEEGARAAREAAERLADRLRPGGIGRGLGQAVDEAVRSDRIAFLDDEFDEKLGDGLIVATRALRSARAQFAPGGDFAMDLTPRYSTQLALYDGGGARYRRHVDVAEDAVPPGDERRELTAVYYLNDSWQGGSLRLFLSTSEHVDVEPRLDRLVLFRSITEHEVLSTSSRRFALTQWWHSRGGISYSSSFLQPPKAPPAVGPTIFVSIAAYRDPELAATIASAFEQAARPDRVSIGIVLQYDTLCASDDVWLRRDDTLFNRVRWSRVDYRDAAGPCPARALALAQLYREEDFVLQIDSHTRFRPNWDDELLTIWRQCGNDRAILTAYPMDFADFGDLRPTLLAPETFDDDGILRIVGRILRESRDQPIPSALWCAGFSFCAARALVHAVPYDPYLGYLFFGEELDIAARLWTHGYDFFAPPRAILYHKWSRKGRHDFTKDADRLHPKLRADLRARSIRRLKAKLSYSTQAQQSEDIVGPYLARFGLGQTRTLAEFEAAVGIDLANCTIKPGARDAGIDPDAFVVQQSEAKRVFAKALL